SLADSPVTLLHGDAKLENLGLGKAGLVAVDWGELTGFGPAEVDVAWYALMGAWRIGGTPDDVFSDYVAAGGELDVAALDAACLGSLAQMGFRLAGHALKAAQPESRARAAELLDYWVRRSAAALDRS